MSGDLPRPIKGGSLHHSHGVYNGSGGTSMGEGSSSSHISVHHQHQYSPFAFSPSTLPFSLASTSTGVPTRAEFAVPVLPQRTRALVVPQSLPFGPGQAHGTVYSASGPSSVSASKRGRRPYPGERQDAIWSPEVQEAFLQAARSIPNNGKNWIMRDGKQYGRNALIAEEIYRLTGQHRTRQQISSHIQVLKKVHADDPTMMRILNGQLDDVPPSASSGTSQPAAGTPTAPLPPSRFSSNSTSPPVMVKAEGSGSSASPPPIPNLDPIENLMSGQSLMSVIRSSAPGSVTSDMSLPGTPQSPRSTSNTDSKSEPVQIAELIPRSDVPPEPMPRALTEPLAADRPESPVQPRAWRGERLAYITAITIWAERTLKDAGVRSRPTTTHVFAQMHSASCPLEPLPADMEGIVRHIQPGTCMHAEIGIALPPPGLNVGKIRATLVIEAMKAFDGYCLTDAFCGQEGRFMSTHTTVFPTGREAREKYSWTYEVPYATEVWRKVLKENPQGAHGMRLVQKYVRGLAGGNRDGDLNVPLLVVHDIKIVPQGGVGYSKIKHIDLTGEQAKHDALGVLVRAVDDDSEGDESSGDTDGDGDTRMGDGGKEGEGKRPKPSLSVAIPESGGERSTRANQLQGSQPSTPFEQVVHTPQPPPERDQQRTWMWAPTPAEEGVQGEIEPKISLEDHINGFLGHALGDGGSRTGWLTRDAPALGEYAGREQRLDAPVRSNGYFPMT